MLTYHAYKIGKGDDMLVNQYKNILLEWFYYDKDNDVVRRAKDGYHGKYKKDDIVKPYKLCSYGYNGVHIPTTRKTIPYHHLITILRGIEIPDDAVIDHINGDTTDNRASNIRIVTQELNCKNRRKRKTNTSGITGIHKINNSFAVRISLKGKRYYLGSRKTLEEAQQLLNSFHDKLIADGYTERHGK